MQNLPIGEVLKEYGYITQEQIDQALQFQKTQSGKKVRFGTLLQEMGFVTETKVLEALGKKLDLQMVNLEEYEVNVDVVAKVPKQLAEKYNVIALSENDSRLQLAMSDPLNFYAQEDIRQIVDMPLEVLLSESPKIKKAIEYYYAEISTKQAAKKANISAEDIEVPQLTADDADDDVPIIKLINSLLVRGYSTNASDIHIEPFKDFTQVRMRIDGQMVSYLTLEKALHNSIVARIKIMSNLNIAEKRIPQDGNFHAVLEGIDISMRISVLPTTHGEKIVMRYLVSDTKIDHAGHFGMNEYSYNMLMKMMSAPNGIIYITGPTGSGKTTTLYMVLQHLSQRPVNISTIEDPVEYVYESGMSVIHQREIGVDTKSFAASLRSALREDPDVILVGEMRDYETISAAVTAAETGHLVMSTLHTTGAAQTLDRIIDSCPPHAQNQIRTQLSTILKGVITQALIPLAMGGGRVAATEILVGTDAVGSLIRDNKCFQLATVMQSSAALGMHTLNADLARLVRAGTIRRDDAIRVSNNKNEILDLLS